MDDKLKGCSLYRSPHTFINKRGEPILIKLLDEPRRQQLIGMYLAYEPRNSVAGLPPIQDAACVRWVEGTIRDAVNLIAVSYEQGVVGHAALFPIDQRTCEMFILISRAFQDVGIGTELVRCMVRLCSEMGLEGMWISVDAINFRALHVYRKCGFECLSSHNFGEVEMALDLRRLRDAVSVSVSLVMNRQVVAVNGNERCKAVLDLFLETRLDSLPVVTEHHELIGIISQTDLMLPTNLGKRVSEVLTREVITVPDDCTLDKVIHLFVSMHTQSVPVVDRRRKLVGVVSRKDILAYYREHLRSDG